MQTNGISGQMPDYEDADAYQVNVPSPNSMNINGRSQLVPTIGTSLLSPQLSAPTGMISSHTLPQYADGGSVDGGPLYNWLPKTPSELWNRLPNRHELWNMLPSRQNVYNHLTSKDFLLQNGLPAAGGLLAGTFLGPEAAPMGAAAGGGLGSYLTSRSTTPGGIAKDVGLGAAMGYGGEKVGQYLWSKMPSFRSYFGGHMGTQAPNVAQHAAASNYGAVQQALPMFNPADYAPQPFINGLHYDPLYYPNAPQTTTPGVDILRPVSHNMPGVSEYIRPGHTGPNPNPGFNGGGLVNLQMERAMPVLRQSPRLYAKGGLAQEAENVREAGTDGDTVLAHISPLEALQLSAQAGGASINPHTGLPSYKFKPWKILKPVVQIAAPFVGGALGGPAGAALGGALGGVIGGGKHKVRNALIGGGLGFVGAGGLGKLGGIGNTIPAVNKAIGLSSLIKPLGNFGAMQAATPAAAKAAAVSAATPAAASGGVGGLGDFFNMGNISNIAGLTALASIPFAKKQQAKEESLANFVERSQPHWREDQKYRPVKPLKRALREIKADEYLEPGSPELAYYEETNPEFEYMAKGGYLDGHTGGQADDIDAKLSDGEFVISADVVSHLGDGNNKAGAQKLYDLMHNVRAHKTAHGAKRLPPKAKSLTTYLQARGH